jgi:hypothetical protein
MRGAGQVTQVGQYPRTEWRGKCLFRMRSDDNVRVCFQVSPHAVAHVIEKDPHAFPTGKPKGRHKVTVPPKRKRPVSLVTPCGVLRSRTNEWAFLSIPKYLFYSPCRQVCISICISAGISARFGLAFRGNHRLAAGNDLHNLQSIACSELAAGEFGRRNRFAVVLDHNAARQKILRN